ncbi:hypothetical protein V6N12_013099 [Hibiscus sabdariffa]|uniref:DUF4283 domain-containing protein n=1 Tax=Hibiscus sabdariffa TaxID=183260 RepID=A0ABR2EGC7_9ROSI
MKKGAMIVNNAQGEIMDTQAIASACSTRRIAASPSPLEEQPFAKKSKQDMQRVADFDNSVMETNSTADWGFEAPNGVIENQHDRVAATKASYAFVTTTGSDVNMRNNLKATTIDEEIVVLEEDVILKRDEAIPSIQFLDKVHDQINCNLRNAIVVRLLGRNIGFNASWNRIHAIWKPVREVQFINLDNNYFLARVSDEGDYILRC